jgi:hypothetical protein
VHPDPTVKSPALANGLLRTKLRPSRSVKLPPAAFEAKLASASFPLVFWIAEPAPRSITVAAFVTMFALSIRSVALTSHVPPVNVVPDRF